MSKSNPSDIIILGDDRPSTPPVEVFNIEKQKDRLLTASLGDDYTSRTRSALEDSVGWLPFFAEKYNISADIKDYVLVPVSVFLSGIPNKKGHAFTIEELTSAEPNMGLLRYETFNRQPLHEDHKNGDYSIARGVVLATSLQPAPEFEGDVFRCVCLQAFDRRTHPCLANKIMTGEINSYSMGARASGFKCSVCGHGVPGHCNHVPRGMAQGTGFDSFTKIGDKLAYLEAQGSRFFEISALNKNNPAWAGATNARSDLMQFQ